VFQKSFHRLISLVVFLLGYILLTAPVLAADFSISAQLSTSSPVVNNPLSINTSVQLSSYISDGIIDVEIYNSSGNKVFQQFFDHQNINSNQAVNFASSWTPNTAGNYQVKVGVFTSNWSSNPYWQDNATSFNVTTQSTSTNNYLSQFWNLTSGQQFSVPTSDPNLSRNDDQINFDWGNNSPDPQINTDRFVARFTKQQNFSNGNYHFTTVSDDGIRLWFDNDLLIDQWNDHPQTTYSADKLVSAGTHTIKIEYYENYGGAIVKFDINQNSSSTTSTSASTNNVNTSSGYTVGQDGHIYKNGQNIVLNGVSWFGAEGGNHSPHGLWLRNWQGMISQIKNTGFNAVRVPFCPTTLTNANVDGIDYDKNPDLVNLKSLDVLDKVVNELNKQQMYILFDHHTPDCQTISDLWSTPNYSEGQWINDLNFVANRYKSLEYFVGIDIKNEPKGSATWGTGNQTTDWNLAAQRAGQSILKTNSNILLFIQGVESNPTCSNNSIGHWWGGNFEPQKCTPLDTNYIPQNKVVYTPHVYGPDVFSQSYFNDSNFPGNMSSIWDNQFGFLKNQNKAIAIGEFGGKYGHGGDQKDITWQNSFIDYLISKGICNNFYWSWNPNSGDTGGVLKDDWSTIWQDKADLLNRYKNSCK
jgi:endoglucanase